jgi:hypothetical protein
MLRIYLYIKIDVHVHSTDNRLDASLISIKIALKITKSDCFFYTNT